MRPSTPPELQGLGPSWALVGARVWTGDGALHEAIAFGERGRVTGIGRAADVRRTLPSDGEVVDAGGAFVCPGFVDPHVHVRAAASAELATDVSDARDLVAAVRSATSGRRGWVTLAGADLDQLPADRRRLDEVSAGCAVRVRDRTGHGWLFNTRGVRALGVEGEVPDGVTVQRAADRTPTGFVADHVGWVGARLGRVSGERELAGAVRRWSRALARRGVVAVCDATSTNGAAQIRSLSRWREEGALVQEATALVAPGARLDPCDSGRRAGVKFADAHDPRLAEALRCEARVAVHCIDPAETGAALRAAHTAGSRRRAALRIEHAAFVPEDWIAAACEVGATVVTHPSFIAAHGDRYLADALLEPHDWLYRLQSWTRGGVPLAFASDAPFGPAAPLDALRDAAARRTAAGTRIGAAEAFHGEPALRALTSVAADCAGLGRRGYGRLRPGGPGAAVVLSDDPRRVERLADLRVIATVIGGAVAD